MRIRARDYAQTTDACRYAVRVDNTSEMKNLDSFVWYVQAYPHPTTLVRRFKEKVKLM
jgi:hypothetical protein